MRTELDALLSLQRYVAQALPEPWTVYAEPENEQLVRPFAIVSRDGDADTDAAIDTPQITVPFTVYAYPDPGDTRAVSRQREHAARDALWQLFVRGLDPGRQRLVPLWDYAGHDAVQRVTVDDGATSFRLNYDGTWTAPLAQPAQPWTVQQALEGLAGAGNVWCPNTRLGGPFVVRFTGALAGQPQDALTAEDAAVEVLHPGSPDPWRSPRDFAEVDRGPTMGGLPDTDDARLRTITVGVRLTWGRAGNVPSPSMILERIGARVSAR